MILLPIAVAVFANVLYHVASKSIPAEQNAFMGLIVNYATALLASTILFFLTPHEKILVEATKSNWACVLMGLSITGVEVAFVTIYRGGGFYNEQITAQKIFGATLCIAGVIMLSLP